MNRPTNKDGPVVAMLVAISAVGIYLGAYFALSRSFQGRNPSHRIRVFDVAWHEAALRPLAHVEEIVRGQPMCLCVQSGSYMQLKYATAPSSRFE